MERRVCACSADACVEIGDGRVVVMTWAFTVEIVVDRVVDVKLLRGNEYWFKEC